MEKFSSSTLNRSVSPFITDGSSPTYNHEPIEIVQSAMNPEAENLLSSVAIQKMKQIQILKHAGLRCHKPQLKYVLIFLITYLS